MYSPKQSVFQLGIFVLLYGLVFSTGPAFAQRRGPATPTVLEIPQLDAIKRADRRSPPTAAEVETCEFILKTKPHAVAGNAYVIVTDHQDSAYLEPLERLAKHHGGTVLRVNDLGNFGRDEAPLGDVTKQLQAANPRYVAIAPRPESYRENMLLGMFQALSTLDPDPQLDALPGLLVAPNASALAALIDHSIAYAPPASDQLRPFVIGQVTDFSAMGQRSLQKLGILKNLFDDEGYRSSNLVVRLANAKLPAGSSPAPFEDQELAAVQNRPITELPAATKQALADAQLWIMFGHGVPGMTCSLDVQAFHDLPMTDKIVLCGSCFSAAPQKSDFPAMRRGADGSEVVNERERFAMRAIENGAVAVFGHMRTNGGFPQLFPVLEGWMQGLTVGEAYQRQINAIIEMQGFVPGQFVLPESSGSSNSNGDGRAAERRNRLLYVVIGDPALQPLVAAKGE